MPRVPVTLREDRAARAKETAPLRVRFTYTLFAHSPAIHVRAEWRNEHREHRLTVDFPTGLRTARAEAHSAFDVVAHEAPFLQEPCRDFVTAAAKGKRFTILSRGMHSHDAGISNLKSQISNSRPGLVLTKCLLKANGWVNRDLIPYWEAPGGNCLRPLAMEYALLPGRESDTWAELARAADGFRSDPYLESHTCAPGGALPATASLLSVSGPFEVTALKRSERGDSLILRMVNLSPRAATARGGARAAIGNQAGVRHGLERSRGEANCR